MESGVVEELKKLGRCIRSRRPSDKKRREAYRRAMELKCQYQLSDYRLAREMNLTRRQIRHNVSRLIALQAGASSQRVKRVCLNPGAFKEINTPEKAYWVGMLMADGAPTTYSVGMELGSEDRQHLVSFADFLGADNPIVDFDGKDGPMARLYVSRVELARDLAALGVVRKRKDTAAALRRIEPKFHVWFWRGMLDGDGHIRRTIGALATPLSNWQVGLAGSKSAIRHFIRHVRRELSVRLKAVPNGSVSGPLERHANWKTVISGPAALRLMRHFWGEPGPMLERKGQLAQALVSLEDCALGRGWKVARVQRGLQYVNVSGEKELTSAYLRLMRQWPAFGREYLLRDDEILHKYDAKRAKELRRQGEARR